jgi:Starch-binding associating with outer membrane
MNWNMKLINKSFVLGSLLLTVFATSCKKAWYDINKDPNNAVESNITPDLVAPQALLNTANRVGVSFGYLGNWLGYWCPAANYAPNVEEQSYNISTGFGAGTFNAILDNAYDYTFMSARAKETNQTFYEGIARVMKSHNFAQLVDMYNQVPYFEALQGLKNVRPKYDDGKTVYEDLIKQLDTAITQIKGAVVSENLNISSADVMFHGDQTMWVKFANTLKLRLLMHQANRSDRATYIQAEIAKIVAEGSGFLGSGEDASVNPTFQVDKPNAFYASFGFNQVGNQATDFWRANIIAMNFLKGTNDPRLGAFYKPIVNGLPGGASEPFSQPTPNNYRGNQYGLSINNVTYPYQTANYVSQVGGIGTAGAVGASAVGLVKGYNQNSWILTSVESLFLQAEATERGWLAGNKETAYKNAVLESFKWLNVGGSAAAATTAFNTWYGDQATNATVNYTIATDKPKLIAYQKYLAMNGTNHLEAWTDYRRNGNYPVIPLSVNPGRTSNTLPYRLLFPQAEINLNTANVPTVGRKTADAFSDKIWWMP